MKVSVFSDLSQATESHQAEADRVADKAQERMASPTQQGLHTTKAEEAGRPDAPRPFLEAEANALGETVETVASRVLEKRKIYAERCAKIEALRVKAKADIRRAESAVEQKRIVNRLAADTA